MKIVQRILVIFFSVSLLLYFTACENEGPAEKTGEKIDKMVEQSKESLEKTGEKIEEGMEKTGKKIEEAGEKLQD